MGDINAKFWIFEAVLDKTLSVTHEEVLQIICEGESERLEFKKSTAQLSAAGETLCGFLNCKGGILLIGVTDEGRVVGQDVSDSTQQEIAQMLRRFDPMAPVTVEFIAIPESKNKLILFSVPHMQGIQPYCFQGRAYQRIASVTSIMPSETYRTRVLDGAHQVSRWENASSHPIALDDLDTEEIRRTARTGREKGRLPEDTGDDPLDLLTRLRLRENGKILQGAVVLYGKESRIHYPQCSLRLARFKGLTKDDFIDSRMVTGHAFLLLDEAMTFLRRHLPISSRFVPDQVERIDEMLFPYYALREAIVNALCHRDYSIVGGAVSVAIFDDRVEIWSTGQLPFGLRPEALKHEHESKPRNPLIAYSFYLRGIVETWGRGTQRIVSLCKAAEQTEPEFFEQAGSVVVRFRDARYKGAVTVPEKAVEGLTERQRELLSALGTKDGMSLREIKQRLVNPAADRTLQSDFAALKKIGLVTSSGRGRGALYRLKK